MSASLHAAAVFLIRPLALLGTHTTASLQTLQLFLHTTLLTTSTLSGTPAPLENSKKLVFSPNAPPPLPVHLACLASGIAWADWARVLGGSAFMLIIEPTIVYVVRTDNGNVGVIWAAESLSSSPASLLPKPQDTAATSTVHDSDSDSESTSNSSSSRPSSRSSHYSTFSFSSHSSASSNTSCSSTPSKIEEVTPAQPIPTPTNNPTNPTSPSHNNSTKYLYQGGVSTVLTGGVMLGSASPPPPFPKLSGPPPPQRHPLATAPHTLPCFSNSSPTTLSAPAEAAYTSPPRAHATQNPIALCRLRSAASAAGSWR